MKAPPHPLDWVFHYANAKPTEDTWRRIVLGPVADLTLVPGMPAPELPTFGVKSLADFIAIRDEYRRVLGDWSSLTSPYSAVADQLVQEINERSRLRFKGWKLSPTGKRLVEEWVTEKKSFEELLYSYLAAALKEVSYEAVHGCEECRDFFFEPSRAGGKFCSTRCRNRATVRRYRAEMGERNPPKGKKPRGRPRQSGPRATPRIKGKK